MAKSNTLSLLVTLVELRQALQHHCTAIRATVALLEAGNVEAATARLDGAIEALYQALRGQVIEFKWPCPDCKAEQGVDAWVDHRCKSCGSYLDDPQ